MLLKAQTPKVTLTGKASDFSTINLSYGAQQGFIPKLMGYDKDEDVVFDEWASNAAYVRNNVICIPLSAPGFLDRISEDVKVARRLKRMYADLFSVHPLTIDGLDSTITLEVASHKVGANEEQQEFVKNTRAKSVPVFTFQEKLGKPIQKFLDFLISYGIMDADTQSALVASIGENQEDKDKQRRSFRGNEYTPDFKTGSMIFIELDFLNVNVVDAWYLVNMAPLSSGERKGKRDLSASKELVQYSITMTGMQMVGEPIIKFAQNLIDNMNVFTRIPDDGLVDTNLSGEHVYPVVNPSEAEPLLSSEGEGDDGRVGFVDDTSANVQGNGMLNGGVVDSE